MIFFGPIFLWTRAWWSPRLEKLAVGAALVCLVACNVYWHGWHAAFWPEQDWGYSYVAAAVIFGFLLMETLPPFLWWGLCRPGRSTQSDMLYAWACLLTPFLLLGSCLLLGWLVPPGYRHWMDVPLVALLVAPRFLAAPGQRLRERMPLYLMGWGGDFEVQTWKRA
jgi:hypothetical protein